MERRSRAALICNIYPVGGGGAAEPFPVQRTAAGVCRLTVAYVSSDNVTESRRRRRRRRLTAAEATRLKRGQRNRPGNKVTPPPSVSPSRPSLRRRQIEKEDRSSELDHLREKLEKNQLLISRLQEEKETAHRENERLLEKYDR